MAIRHGSRLSRGLLGSLLLLAWLSSHARAQDTTSDDLTGRVDIGFRGVGVDGREPKYRQHVNLDDGPRLFGLELVFRPSGDLRNQVDRIDVDLDHLGGDPFGSFRFAARKAGAYDVRYDHRTSDYFYEDIILPTALATTSLDNEGDISSFDFQRVRDAASVRMSLTPEANLRVGFDRYAKRGARTLAMDIQRDVFELERPVAEELDDFNIGFDYSWPKATLFLEERFQRFESSGEIFTAGLSEGLDPENTSRLDFFFLDQPYEYDSFRQTVGVNSRPTTKLTVQGSVVFETLDLDGTTSERSQGVDFRGLPFATSDAGVRAIDRNFSLLTAGVSYTVRPNLVVNGSLRRNDLDQDGEFMFGDDEGRGLWNIGTTQLEGGLVLGVAPRVTVSGGMRYETRDVEYDQSEGALLLHARQTDHLGVFAGLGWRPGRLVKMHAEIETGTFDDPFTLASPTDRVRFKIGGDVSHGSGAFGSATFLVYRLSNDNSGWDSDSNQINLRGGYRDDRLVASAGYALVDVRRNVDQTINPLPGFGPPAAPFLFPVLFDLDTNFVDGRVHWVVHDRVTLGTDLRYYTNDGSFAVTRRDHRVFARIGLGGGYDAGLTYRNIAYDETTLGFNDYDADLVEVSLGYRW